MTWKKGEEAKASLALPSLPIVSTSAMNMYDCPEQSVPQSDKASMGFLLPAYYFSEELWSVGNVLKQQFLKKHKPKYRAHEYVMESSPFVTYLHFLTQLQCLKPRAKVIISWHLRVSRSATSTGRNMTLWLFWCPATHYQCNLTSFWNKVD